MAKPKTLTDRMVAKLKPGAKRLTLPDPLLRGHYVRVTPKGAKSYVAVARDPGGKQIWATLGSADVLTIDEARDQAREAIKRIKAGKTAFEPPPVAPDSFEAVADNWMRRHVQTKGLRSEYEISRLLCGHLIPFLGARDFEGIRRSDVAALLDRVEDKSGPRQADAVLAVFSSMANWYAARSDSYVPPLARGMRRDDPHARRRERILDDEELRRLWAVADGAFGAFIKVALTTAQRRAKITTMRWEDVAIDGTWTIPVEAREKGSGGALLLPEIAIDAIRSQPRITGNPYVFAGNGAGPFTAHHKRKQRIDERAKIAPWVIHDLRRTSRSLMARARVRPDIAEQIMGHAIQGVAGTYNRYDYFDEKADALAKLAGLIVMILDPPSENVVPMREVAE